MLEYANLRGGTELSDRRIANGAAEPYDIRMWCLGNEMDGPWQVGHGTPREYGRLAVKTARAMRQIDPTLELVVCGSSSAQMPLFGTWERIVLEETYDEVDFISCHAYYEPIGGRLRELPRVRGEHGSVHRVRRRHRRPRQGGARQRQDDQHLVRRVERLVPLSLRRGRPDHRPAGLAGGAPAARGRVLGGRRRRLRQPAHLADPARRSRHRGEPGPAGQRDRTDHDRAGRRGVAADHLLPLRGDFPPRARGHPRAEARLPDV